MTIEEELQNYIISKFKSVMNFSKSIGIPYTTVKGIFNRGIWGASVQNITKICDALDIDTNELVKGKIKPQNTLFLSNHENKVITAYRQKPEMQPAVDKLLDVDENKVEFIPSLVAARSKNNDEPIHMEILPDLSKFPVDDTDL